jgi:hypothetical protein
VLTLPTVFDLPIADGFGLSRLEDLDPFGENAPPGLASPWSVADPWEKDGGVIFNSAI